jgi:hypothetical protein
MFYAWRPNLPDEADNHSIELAMAAQADAMMDELATVALANYDARVRFETRAARGSTKRALALLDKLDRAG